MLLIYKKRVFKTLKNTIFQVPYTGYMPSHTPPRPKASMASNIFCVLAEQSCTHNCLYLSIVLSIFPHTTIPAVAVLNILEYLCKSTIYSKLSSSSKTNKFPWLKIYGRWSAHSSLQYDFHVLF